MTPGRLELPEDALVGVQLRAATVFGSWDPGGRFVAPGAGDAEVDLEQDVFGALRVLRRGQLALLVPVIETERRAPPLQQLGGGIGDVNAAARYDFVLAGDHDYLPGIALLAGVTFPTGKAPESASPPLAADATGIGAYQLNAALALEQTFGPWLVNATAIVAKRTEHGGETLGTQWTFLAAGAYTFSGGVALALSAAYTFEGDATMGGADVPLSAKRVATVTASGLWPITGAWRLLGSLYANPLGANEPGAAGLTLTVIRSWI